MALPAFDTLLTVLPVPVPVDEQGAVVDWHRRVVGRSLRTATMRSIDRGGALIRAAATLLERSDGESFTVQDVADEAGQSLRTLYQYFESKDDLLLAVFEEAMRTYAELVGAAVADLTDPLERLAGAMLTAARLPESSRNGVNGGLARLRLKLSEAEPELLGRSQAPIAAALRDLVAAAIEAGQVPPTDPEGATFLLLALNTAAITSRTLGNDTGLEPPDPVDLVGFCLHGLGASVTAAELRAVEGRLRLPGTKLSLTKARPRPRAPRP